MTLVKITIDLTLVDVITLRRKYTKKTIARLPFKILVGRTTWYIPERIYKTMKDFLTNRLH